MRKKGSLESWELRRNIAADMHEQGHSPAAIASALKVSVRTVYQWLARLRSGGREALQSRKPTGRRSRLSEEQKQWLGELLLKTPEQNGFAGRYLWTQQLIAHLIEREFGIRYHHDRICRILKRMGFTHQKPARRAKERDEAKIQQWRTEVWPALLKKVPTPAE
jgi:putative transposase